MSAHVRGAGLCVIAALSCLHAAGVACSGQLAIEGEPLAEQPVEALLQSLTFDDFEYREAVVRQLAKRDWRDAAKLAHVARDETLPLHLRARYMLRRTFRELAPRLAEEAIGDDPQARGEARGAFEAMVDLYPLDAHHHGGLQKLAIAFEELRLYEPALNAYRGWEPPQTFCGTCTAEIHAEKTEGIVRCLRKLNRFDEAAELCLDQLRNDGFGPTVPFGVALVEIYDARNRLDELTAELAHLDGKREAVQAAREYLEIRQALRAGEHDRLLPHLTGGHLGSIDYDFKHLSAWQWKHRAVAEGFGRLGDKAVPALGSHLEDRVWQDAAWTIYALRQSGSARAVDSILEWAKQQEQSYPLECSRFISETLQQFPRRSTQALVPLLEHPECGHGAVYQLGNMGTEEAVETLIEHFNGDAYAAASYGEPAATKAGFAEHCAWALWRLTGESLGMDTWSGERLLQEGRETWKRWWAERPDGFEVKTPAWWRSAEAAPVLVEALNSPARRYSASAVNDLLALEHPVLAGLLDPSDAPSRAQAAIPPIPRFRIAREWLRFDPAAAIPALIDRADVPGSSVRETLHPVLAPLRKTNKAAWEASLKADDEASWSQWWEKNKTTLNLKPRERWW